jgi:hypothetical protein
MTRSRGFAHLRLGSAGWLLPWIAVLFVSATLAYAMSGAVHGGASARDHQPDVQAAPSTGEAAGPTGLEQSTTSLSDTPMEPSGGGFGVMSTTSPASTGHASPDGCCTWDSWYDGAMPGTAHPGSAHTQ